MLSGSRPDSADGQGDWMVVVPTRGDDASALRVSENVVGRLDGVRVLVVRNSPVSGRANWANLAQLSLVEVIDRPGGGVARARNAALSVATARTVVFVDDDIVVSDSALRTLVARQRAAKATIATARVVAAKTPHNLLFDADLGFDRGDRSAVWRAGGGQGAPLSPLNVWQFGVGATFAVDLHLLSASGEPVYFDERLSNGLLCGGSEDVDFFYTAYLRGHTVCYAADAVVEHLFPLSAKAVSAKCRQYALSDGAFYAKWARRVSAADLRGEFTGWTGRMMKHVIDRAHGRSAIPLADLLAEPLYKLAGGVSWALILRRSC